MVTEKDIHNGLVIDGKNGWSQTYTIDDLNNGILIGNKTGRLYHGYDLKIILKFINCGDWVIVKKNEPIYELW
jgi:hypothetical protein